VAKTTAESCLNADEFYKMVQRLFLLPAGEGQDEGERDDIPDLGEQQKRDLLNRLLAERQGL
jgi:hypothetical protein